MTILLQRGNSDIGDVLDVDERLCNSTGRERDNSTADRVGQEILAEVLREETRSHDGPFRA